MAPRVAEVIHGLRDQGRLTLHAGRLIAFDESPENVRVTFQARGEGEPQQLTVQRVINCTGPECDYRRMRHPLAVSLLEQGLARPDPLALGLETDARGALIDAEGHASRVLFTLGPVRKGMLWETTAVPEIRGQAKELASELLRG